MALFDKKTGGFMDEIRCDEQDYLIWKWHPKDAIRGKNNRENAIRWGSSLRVREGSVAAFVYNKNESEAQDFIEGPHDEIIKSSNFPVLANIVGLAYEGGTPFQAEVYFINLAKIIQIKFGVPFFEVYDPRFLDFGVPVAVRGTLSFNITDYREFVKLHRLDNFNLDDFQRQIRDAIIRYVKDSVANIPTEENIPVIQLERKIEMVNNRIGLQLEKRLKDNFGVSVIGVDIAAIEVDKNSEGYLRLKSITQDITVATVKAQAEINIKNLQDIQRINAENMEETMRIQREEAQYAQHKTTQTANFAAFQTEVQRDVGVAGAEALGKMGSTGSISDSGNGMNPAAMMAGMAIGGAMGQNIAGTMNSMMAGVNQQVHQGSITHPPVPSVAYHVAVDGQATGPYNIATLTQMVSNGKFTENTLVWKPGMTEWVTAKNVQELQSIFSDTSQMPPIPPVPPTL